MFGINPFPRAFFGSPALLSRRRCCLGLPSRLDAMFKSPNQRLSVETTNELYKCLEAHVEPPTGPSSGSSGIRTSLISLFDVRPHSNNRTDFILGFF